ncbi:hypothetical protein ACWD4O_38815 [Streptomyces sp. NPDC002623]
MPRTRTRTGKPATPKPASKRPAKKTTPRKALPVRPRPFMTDVQGYAVLAARISGITTPHINAWIDHHDGTATRPLDDGTLHYHHKTRTLTWQATCRMGATHTYLITNPGLAHMARMLAARCTQIHHDLAYVEALTADEQAEFAAWAARSQPATEPATRPVPTWARPEISGNPRALADTLTHATTSTADTEPLNLHDIAEGLAARTTADTEAPKEHPQP